MRTAFTVSIEAREGIATGISAADRARTIATAIDPTKDHNDIVSPGHVFPLIAREGGVLVRAGHTEASVDLCRMAGLYALRRHLRDHERRRHHGAHAGPRAVRAAPRPQDRHHRGPDQAPPAPRPHRQADRQSPRRQRVRRRLHDARLRDDRRPGGTPRARQGRLSQARPDPRARARRQPCRRHARHSARDGPRHAAASAPWK